MRERDAKTFYKYEKEEKNTSVRRRNENKRKKEQDLVVCFRQSPLTMDASHLFANRLYTVDEILAIRPKVRIVR